MTRSLVLAVSLLVAGFGWGVVRAAPAYVTDAGASSIDFTGVQAGAAFKGTFHKFSAAIEFSPDALPSAHFDVVIDLSSVDTLDKDRDTTMRGPDIFDVAHFPTAHYVTRTVTKTATGYSATGSLTLRGVTKDVPIDFQWAASAAGAAPVGAAAKLQGTATLKRLDFGVGQGDWKSTEWIADSVKIAFSLVLKPKP
jgi:polyisoprenoid-binding protein YceI